MFKKFGILVLMCSLVGWGSQPSASAKKSDSLQIKGSDTMVNLVQGWAEEFMQKNPDDFIAVTGGGSGTGIAALINGTCEVAMSSREIKEKEISLAEKKGVHPKQISVALDGLAVVVHKDNPVSNLTLDQLADIFSGRVTNWKEVGGNDAKIVILSREVNSGTHVYFKEHVLRKGDAQSKEEFSPEALLLPSSQAIADEIQHNPGAIGYYGMGYISKHHKAVAVAKDARSEYVYPTVDDVVSGKYPISRPLFIYVNGELGGSVKKFIDFILSEEGQALVVKLDFVPLKK
ncbi:MAG: phosphate ABC transporter substrate-binding protein [Candidatus Omnitrophota bacterium]